MLVRDTETGSAAPDSPLALRALTAADGEAYARAIGTDSPTTFTARLSEATTCYAVEDDRARILHASWVTTACAWTRELRSSVCPPPGDAYVYESFTRADARGRGVYPFALEQISRDLHKRGVGHLWVAVEGHNQPSLRAVAKAGFVPSFELRYARRLGLLRLELPDDIKTDTSAKWGRKKRRIRLTGDGAIRQ